MGNRRRQSGRKRVGSVSYYFHHGSWWIYYLDRRESDRPIRRSVAKSEREAAVLAARVNAQLATAAPTLFSFNPLSVGQLQSRFIEHHEHVIRSSLATVKRYRSATQHLVNYGELCGHDFPAHEIDSEGFVRYLRSVTVAPNGHANSVRRRLLDKGVRYILDTCRSMYSYAAKKRHLPPYGENPFAGLGGKRFSIEDAKRIFIYSQTAEAKFLLAADKWAIPVHFFLAKTGLRPGEAVHLMLEDVDLDAGWVAVRNKSELGWRIKTGRERSIPLIEELVEVLRRVIGKRRYGPLFVREKFNIANSYLANKPFDTMVAVASKYIDLAEREEKKVLSREHLARIHRSVWRDAGMIRRDTIRNSFMRINRGIDCATATCPKSWRHTFATLLQDANVDPLIRQITLGHAPANGQEGALGMTSLYTHTRPETQKREIERALRLWPESLQIARSWAQSSSDSI